jgi:Ca-activated chloride channel family protein
MAPRLFIAAGWALLMLGGSPRRAGAADGSQDNPVSIEPRLRFTPTRRPSADSPGVGNFRINSNLVLIPVNVVDVRDRQVLGLTREQFRIYDNEVEQSITQFASEDAPVSVAIVFDSSASMAPKLRDSREAVAEIVKTANPDDEFTLIEFNSRVHRLVDLTPGGSDILNRLFEIRAKGQTALLDAIYLAVSTMRRARHSRKAIVIISDGGDNCSRYSPLETRQMVREADVQIFAIGIFGMPDWRVRSREEIDGPGLLRSIAEETGGRMFSVDKTDGLSAIAAEIGMSLRHEYLLGYSPAEIAGDGKYHTVKVKVNAKDNVKVFWKAGYYAPGRW